MKNFVSAAALAAAMLATPALAAEFNGSVGYSAFAEDTYDVDLGAVTARLGAQITPNFGVEAEASFGTESKQTQVGYSNVDVSLNHMVGLHLVGSYPVNDSFDIFGRIGVSTAEAEAEATTTLSFLSGPYSISGPNSYYTTTATTTATESGTGGEIGIGARYFFAGGNHGIRGDAGYSDTLGATAFSIGYAFRFGE